MMAKGFVANIGEATLSNSNFRKVLYTAKHTQLVLMTLPPNSEIGEEVHPDNDQFFRVEEGEGKAIIDGNEQPFSVEFAIIVPAGSKHNIINTSTDKPLKVYTLYSPPHHKDGTIHTTKDEALRSDEEFDGILSE
jgi:mannose-6-phosphate isomerase-like protein (cupin superfamily)